ncbi:MAG TPA: MarR family winged helix-turn-helix transcriptional regulator [Solirubrobacteraceae bacterium]|jgi:DNA-binding MarR family transcriptional regulator|nr:MarR family winged helix-turn-helix transcriptional regulator [Solirubrobacteraceae bacterium]
MAVVSETSPLEGSALEAWRSYLQSHAGIVRELDADLIAQHGLTVRDYEVLLYLAQADDRMLPMSALSERTMLTRSGITRLIDGLVGQSLIERVSCSSDARVSYARLTDTGYTKLREAGCTHVAGIERLFLANFSAAELEQLAGLLSRLPGAIPGGACTVEADGDAPSVEPDGGACSVS